MKNHFTFVVAVLRILESSDEDVTLHGDKSDRNPNPTNVDLRLGTSWALAPKNV